MKTINISRDFSKFPGGRYKSIGKGSGEEFRERFLIPALERGEPLVIDMDGTEGYPPSFLEEAFGGLVRLGFSENKIWKTIRLKTSPRYHIYKSMAEQYVHKEAERE